MEQKLIALLADLFSIPKEDITDELAINDIELWDSLKHMELVITLEQAFNIELTSDEIMSMKNINEIKRIIKNKVANN